MSHVVYGKKLTEYRSQLNEYLIENNEIKTEFELMLSRNDYQKLSDIEIKVQTMIKMVRDHPMHLKIKDFLYDFYCNNPKNLDSKFTGAPNISILYESMVNSVSVSKVIKEDMSVLQNSERQQIHQAY